MPFLMQETETPKDSQVTAKSEDVAIEVELEDSSHQHFDENAVDNTSSERDVDDNHGGEDLNDYHLARDRRKIVTHPPMRYTHVDLTAYALNVAKKIEYHEPNNYLKAINRKESN